jgi:hypothetical protein
MRCGIEELERVDATLVSLARIEAALRLRLGQALEVLGRGGVFDLGFSSLAAYAQERCERSARWAEGARCLARRVESLPELRRAMASGRVSWSMGELLARLLDWRQATPEEESYWLELASSRTIRQMRPLVANAMARANGKARRASALAAGGVGSGGVGSGGVGSGGVGSGGVGSGGVGSGGVGSESGGVEGNGADVVDASSATGIAVCTLTCTVDREDAWLFEATRCLLEQLGERGSAAQCEALLAEAQGTLLALQPACASELLQCGDGDAARRRWVEELRRWRDEAEGLCERNVLGCLLAGRSPIERAEGERAGSPSCADAVAVAAALGLAPLAQAPCGVVDRQVRALAESLARHDLELSRLLLQLHRADGWRRLGYATEAQYARERLGLSQSSLLARRQLALRLERLPVVRAALGAGQIGVEAAIQLVRVATTATEAAWVARARQRTIKHLREEVAAAQTAVRWSGEGDCPPPVDAELAAFQRLESVVVSGRFDPSRLAPSNMGRHRPANDGRHDAVASSGTASSPQLDALDSESRRAWYVMLSSLASWLDGGFQMSAATAGAGRRRATARVGRVTLRLRMSRADATWWRALEALARRWMPRGMSWLKFLCLSMWRAWQHLLGADVAYGHIYVRDRFRCLSPVCNRRDVTPHHLEFRSAGGSDAAWNIGSLCTWCHLLGVHGGRIRALGTAECIHWELGATGTPCVVVHGRERMAA